MMHLSTSSSATLNPETCQYENKNFKVDYDLQEKEMRIFHG